VKQIVIALLIITASCAPPRQAKKITPTVQMVTLGRSSEGAVWPVWGSGFHVSKSEILTAAHVAEQIARSGGFFAHTYYVSGKIARTEIIEEAEIYFHDYADLALIRIPEPNFEPKTHTLCQNFEPGERIVIEGYPARGPDTISGKVWLSRPDEFSMISAKVEHGFSGGPVVSRRQNCVVGVISGGDQEEIGIAVGLYTIKAFLEEIKDPTAFIGIRSSGGMIVYFQMSFLAR